MQVFDLTQLTAASETHRASASSSTPRDIAKEGHAKLGVTFNNTVFYNEFGGCLCEAACYDTPITHTVPCIWIHLFSLDGKN